MGICKGPPPPASFSEPPSWIYKSGPTSVAMREAEDCLSCRVSGAVWIKKLMDQSQTSAAPKKRAKTADLTEENKGSKRAKTTTAKAKASAKNAKGGGKTKSKTTAAVLQQGETCETLQEDMVYGGSAQPDEIPEGTRHRIWIDDLISAITAVMKNHQALTRAAGDFVDDLAGTPTYGSTGLSRLISSALACGLKFCVEGKVKIDKKVLNQWSRARPALQQALKRELDKLVNEIKSALPSATSADDMVQQIASEISPGPLRKDSSSQHLSSLAGAQTPQAAVSAAKAIMHDKDLVSRVEKFVERNNSSSVRVHLAFTAMFKHVRDAVCTCPGSKSQEKSDAMEDLPQSRAPGRCSFHHEAHTLQDFLSALHIMGSMTAIPAADAEVLGAASLIVAGNIASVLRNKKSSVSTASSPAKKD